MVQTGASVPQSLADEDKIFSIHDNDFERMQLEVPSYLKLGSGNYVVTYSAADST